MKIFVLAMFCGHVAAVIRDSVIMNKLKKVKPVGSVVEQKLLPLTELPPPKRIHGRRHLEDCTEKYHGEEVVEGGKVSIHGEDYYDYVAKTVATVVFPDHIDHKFYEVTTQVPYLTVGVIEAIGYHPTTQSPNECERIYQDFLEDQYSAEDTDYSEESLEMARVPVHKPREQKAFDEEMYDDADRHNSAFT